MKKLLGFILVIVVCLACNGAFAQDLNFQAKQQLQAFKLKDKLKTESGEVNYRGLSKPELQPKLNSILNVTADDFIRTLNGGATDKKFQENITIGLARFNPYYDNLDTDDRTRICTYFEELMDTVGLESSGGAINKWMYGFDPTVNP